MSASVRGVCASPLSSGGASGFVGGLLGRRGLLRGARTPRPRSSLARPRPGCRRATRRWVPARVPPGPRARVRGRRTGIRRWGLRARVRGRRRAIRLPRVPAPVRGRRTAIRRWGLRARVRGRRTVNRRWVPALAPLGLRGLRARVRRRRRAIPCRGRRFRCGDVEQRSTGGSRCRCRGCRFGCGDVEERPCCRCGRRSRWGHLGSGLGNGGGSRSGSRRRRRRSRRGRLSRPGGGLALDRGEQHLGHVEDLDLVAGRGPRPSRRSARRRA